MKDAEKERLPELRQDIQLLDGPSTREGIPTWSLYDPVRNQYFRIGWQEYEILSRWHMQDANKIIAQVNKETTLVVALSDIEKLVTFLNIGNLLQLTGTGASEQLKAKYDKTQKANWRKAMQSYLFFKIPLVRPDKFLEATLPYLRMFFTRSFFYAYLIIMVISLYLVSRQWEAFTQTFMHFFTWKGLFFYAIALIGVKVFHELGHAYTAKFYGCRIASIGVAFLVMWPVMYTDTTDSWRLTRRQQRLAIGLAGMIVELAIATIAALLWVFLPDGAIRSACFFIATASWIMTLLINMNPFLRFDGYYILSDIVDLSNLQFRAFALGRWQLREWLFNFGEPMPEAWTKVQQRWLLLYAYCTWVYRFFLFIAIATLVYLFFFKALAIVLVALEVVLLIVRPIWGEVKEYIKRRDKMGWNKHSAFTAALFAFIIGFLVFPWQSHVNAPAMLAYQNDTKMFALKGSQVAALNVVVGQKVQQGQQLLKLMNPKLNYDIAQTQRDIKIIKIRILAEVGKASTLGAKQADAQELASLNSQLLALESQKKDLNIRAPFSGTIAELNEGLKLKHWVAKDELLLELIKSSDARIIAYVPEQAVARIKVGATAHFQVNQAGIDIPAKVVAIDLASTEKVNKPYLTSETGGALPVIKDANKAFILQGAFYRVELKPEGQASIPFIRRGDVTIQTQPQNIIGRIWRSVMAVLVREFGI